MIKAKDIISKINEVGTIWEVFLQIEKGQSVKPPRLLVTGEIEKCIGFLRGKCQTNPDWSGVLVSDNAVGNVFFRYENSHLVTSSSPYPGLRYMTAKEFQPFK